MTDMTPAQIRSALSAGIITQEQANAMLLKAGATALGEESAVIGNEDEMRFVRGFSDIFIAMGMALLVIGLSIFAGFMGGIGFLVAAAIMFALAEYFGRVKRQHLPTLVTAIGFLIFVNIGIAMMMGDGRITTSGNILAAIIGLAAMVVFYIRIKLPFCMALIAISVVYLFFSIVGTFLDPSLFIWGLLFLISGAAILFVALKYDLRDPERVTRWADNAFWLHLVSAPLIIHGLVLMLAGRALNINNTTALLVLAIVTIVSVFGLAINRRALLVSSLGYAGLAIGYFVSQTEGMSIGMAVALTLIILGAAVVFLGAGWHPARRGLLKVLPNMKIFPPAA